MKKVILAFSGGLDTSFCVLHLQKEGYEVITLTVDTGGFTAQEKEDIAKRAKILKVKKHYFVDGRKALYEQFVEYIIKGNVLRGGVYPLSAGTERIIIATELVKIAEKEKASFVAHGSTGAGNDQVRFDITIKALNSGINILAPIRELGIARGEEIKYLQEQGIPVSEAVKSYSINRGMLGVTIGGKETTNSWECPPEEVYTGITPISKTPDKAEVLVIGFKDGLPVGINGKKLGGIEIMRKLAEWGGRHGVGKGIHLGNTVLGIKGRVAFAAPAIIILIKAHKELEKLVLTKWQSFWKDMLAEAYGNFLHEALYFDPVMRDIEAMMDSSQSRVTGQVRVKLFKGNIIVEGCKSPYSLMNPEIAIYGEEHMLWTGQDAESFGKIYGLQSIIAANAKKKGDLCEK